MKYSSSLFQVIVLFAIGNSFRLFSEGKVSVKKYWKCTSQWQLAKIYGAVFTQTDADRR